MGGRVSGQTDLESGEDVPTVLGDLGTWEHVKASFLALIKMSVTGGGTSGPTDLESGEDVPIVLGDLGTWEYVRAWRKRFTETDLRRVRIFHEEQQELSEKEQTISTNIMQIYCWRRSLLMWAGIVYIIKFVMEIVGFATWLQLLIRSYTEEVLWDVHLGSYTQFFRNIVWIDTIWAAVLVLVSIMSLVLVAKSALQWKDFSASVKLVSFAWIAICGSPWLFALVEPAAFTLSLNARGIQEQICEDIIHGSFTQVGRVLDLVSSDLGTFSVAVFDGLESMWISHDVQICDDPSEAFNALSATLDEASSRVDQGQLQSAQLALELFFTEQTWDTLSGVLYIRTSRVGMLFPALLGLMFGVINGAAIIRKLIPYSRIPGLLMFCGVAFSAPFIIVIFVTANALLGNIWLLIGMVCILAALLVVNVPYELGITVKNQWTLMTPVSHETASQGATCRSRLGIALYAVGGIFVIVGLLVGAVSRKKLLMGKESFLEVIQEGEFWVDLLPAVINALLTAWTITSITQVVMSDWVLHLVRLIDGDVLLPGPDSFQDEKKKLMQELREGL
jgi:hypothetical protein